MSFIDNPVIAGLGQELGLGGVFDSMRSASTDTPPAESPTSPPTDPQQTTSEPKPAHSAPIVPEYRNRPYIPRQIAPSAGGVRPGVGGTPAVAPGQMDPATLQDPNVKALLGQYGVTPPTTPPDPNLFIHNPAAFQKHPVLAGVLERGFESLANSHPGANFLQSFTGQLRGNQEANAERAAQVNAQTMAPVQQASAIQALQQKYDEHVASQDNVAYHQGMLKYYNKLADDKENKYLSVAPHYNRETGQFSTLQQDDKSPTGYSWQIDDTLGRDEETYQRHQYVTKGIQSIADSKYGGDVTKVSPEETLGVINSLETTLSKAKAAGANQGRQITANAHVQGAAISANGRTAASRMNPADTADYRSADAEDRAVQQRLNAISDVTKPYQNEQGQIMIPGSKAYKAEVATLQARQQAAQAKKQNIVNKYGGTNSSTAAPAKPRFSSNNPFAH